MGSFVFTIMFSICSTFSAGVYEQIEDLEVRTIEIYLSTPGRLCYLGPDSQGWSHCQSGQFGCVTNLYIEYIESKRDLVAAVRQAEELGQRMVILETCNLILKDVFQMTRQILCS